VRWDGGFEAGNEVTLYYDSLLGKIIVWGTDRADAIRRMTRALEELVVIGVPTNQAFHLRLLRDAAFLRGEIDSQFLDRRPDLLAPPAETPNVVALAVLAALAEDDARNARRPSVASDTMSQGEWARAGRRDGLR
jgi:acetyl/propionyl-CoA carboxylase alpha subunit